MKQRMNLLLFDGIPMEAQHYLSNYGFHFNKRACDFAVSLMKKKDATTGKAVAVTPMTKTEVEELLTANKVTLDNDCLYDAVYVANMLASDMLKSGIPDDAHLALAIKDMIDDIDQRDGYLFVRWYANILFNGMPVDWDELV